MVCTIPMSLIFGVQVEDGDVGPVSFALGRILGNQLGPVWPGVVQDINREYDNGWFSFAEFDVQKAASVGSARPCPLSKCCQRLHVEDSREQCC